MIGEYGSFTIDKFGRLSYSFLPSDFEAYGFVEYLLGKDIFWPYKHK